MDLKAAINFSKDNHLSLDEEEKQIIGISYSPNCEYERFEIFTISYNLESSEGEGEDWFDIACNGEPEWGGKSFNDIINIIPESSKNLNYKVFKAESFLMLEIWYILKFIFPELPDQETSEFVSNQEFENKASILVNELNNST